MRATINDREALAAVSPAALSAYARSLGWTRTDEYGEHSDVYSAAGLPEIILPRTQNLADYPNIVSRLLTIFADNVETDILSLYRDLVTADRDVIRFRVTDSDEDGSVPVSAGVDLMVGAREMILAAACSLRDQRPTYRAGANREATEYLSQVRLGQTEQGSFVVTMLTPVIPPRMQMILSSEFEPNDDPLGRQMTKHLESTLVAIRRATELTNSGESGAFQEAVQQGVSANLCEAIVTLLAPFPTLDATLSWARTRPIDRTRSRFRFASADTPILREAARSLRAQAPREDEPVFGMVRKLQRGERELEGTITLKASIDGKNQSVVAVLRQSDYERAIEAHKDRAAVVMKGDLDRVGQRWHLLKPEVVDVIKADDEPEEAG